jgi:hypothetical protein
MSKERFLTRRWNNILTLGLGVVALVYIAAALSTSVWTSGGGFLALVIIGAGY